mmetsp:Transcript_57992/g.135608  ORF Transcript_57992/g.135608 Transcript_57992/m.135608 type:complete len:449 (-) Transcript_57992:298-1644(-)
MTISIILVGSILCVAAGCAVTSDYPECSAPTASTQRVRREIRSISLDEWQSIVTAMWAMKNETMASGVSRYGAAFRSYDYFVVKHAVAQTDTRGDQAHFGAHFITWHAAFVLEFENALLAIDPSIEALPYWDQTISEPSIFSETYFGVDPDSSTSYQVTTGKFAYWPIASSFSLDDWSEYIANDTTVNFAGNPSGWLRGATNLDTNAFSTRYGGGAAWDAVQLTAATWWECTTGSTYMTWEEWYWCIEGGNGVSIHSGPHREIGGTSGDNNGDFEDTVTSPNSPIFMFHHANMDRNKMWWMIAHSDLNCTYYEYPLVDGGVSSPGGGPGRPRRLDGYNLNEVASSSWGFTRDDLGLSGAPASQLTHADLICWMAPATAVYNYDTHVQCLLDEAECNSIQAAGRPTEPGTGESTTVSQQETPSAAHTAGLQVSFSGVLLWRILSLLSSA